MYCNKLSFWPNDSPIGGFILAKGELASIHYDSVPRPQRSCFANPNSYIYSLNYVKRGRREKVLFCLYKLYSQLSKFEFKSCEKGSPHHYQFHNQKLTMKNFWWFLDIPNLREKLEKHHLECLSVFSCQHIFTKKYFMWY